MIQLLKPLTQCMWAELKWRQHISLWPRTTELSVFGAGLHTALLLFWPKIFCCCSFTSPPLLLCFGLFFFSSYLFLICFLAERFMVAPLLYEAWAFPFRLAFCRSHSLSSHRIIPFCNSFHQFLSLCVAIETICLFTVYAKAHDNRVSQYTHKLSHKQSHTVRLWIGMWTVMTVTALQDSQGPTAIPLPLMSMLTVRVYNGICWIEEYLTN